VTSFTLFASRAFLQWCTFATADHEADLSGISL